MSFLLKIDENGKIIEYIPVKNFDSVPDGMLKSAEEVEDIMKQGLAYIIDDEITYPPLDNMIYKDENWVYPENYLDKLKTRTNSQVKEFASQARRKIVDFADEVKLAEYADKAALAPRLIDQTATDIEIESAVNDAWAKNNNIIDPIEIGKMWAERANGLRMARNAVNLLESNAYDAISSVQNPDDMDLLLIDLEKQADEALDQLLSVATT